MELGNLKEKPAVLRQLENELRCIQQQIDTEQNPIGKTRVFSAYGEMLRALIGTEM